MQLARRHPVAASCESKAVQLCHTCSASACRPHRCSWNGQECSSEGAAAACVPDGQERPQSSAAGHPAEAGGLLSGPAALHVSMQRTVTLDAGMHASSRPCSIQAGCLGNSSDPSRSLALWNLCPAAMPFACAVAATGLLSASLPVIGVLVRQARCGAIAAGLKWAPACGNFQLMTNRVTAHL